MANESHRVILDGARTSVRPAEMIKITLLANGPLGIHFVPSSVLVKSCIETYHHGVVKILSMALAILAAGASNAQDDKLTEAPEIIRALVEIEIPKVRATDATLSDMVEFVAQKTSELDPRQPGPSGISFLTNGSFEERRVEVAGLLLEDEEEKISYSGENVRVGALLQVIANSFQVEFHVTSVGVIITPVKGKAFPNAKGKSGKTYYLFEPNTTEQPRQPSKR